MSSAPVQAQPRQESETTSISLFDVLHNSLILCHVAPYLPIHSLLQLASASKDVRSLVFNTPGVFRHLDLTQVQRSLLNITASDLGPEAWRNSQIDGNIPFEDFLSRPLRGVLNAVQQQNILKNVQTLVLDGLSVTSEICHEIINDASYNVRILSIREVKNLNHAKLRGALQYACRPTRPKASPRLKALYVFGPKDGHTDHTNDSISVSWNRRSRDALASSTQLKGDPWWSERGQIVSRPISRDWVSCVASCEGIIAFDAVLCRGPRHQNSPVFGQPLILGDTAAAAATYAVAGCEGCGKAPEGLTSAGTCAAVTLPALAPVPIIHSYRVVVIVSGSDTAHAATNGGVKAVISFQDKAKTMCVKHGANAPFVRNHSEDQEPRFEKLLGMWQQPVADLDCSASPASARRKEPAKNVMRVFVLCTMKAQHLNTVIGACLVAADWDDMTRAQDD
ncbi:hypothetical protein AAL_04702 [Moelleriella libera RCEF 2490]|uniref:F-box domain-containing protein n=1 Tax=Moelleriella libera RCEF 2490 TaxID=1081109 RepID=A0A168BLW0_9HYPO|nr:hypothetical protein AAL_04702 [Moelleriella libera RCEF 2490]